MIHYLVGRRRPVPQPNFFALAYECLLNRALAEEARRRAAEVRNGEYMAGQSRTPTVMSHP